MLKYFSPTLQNMAGLRTKWKKDESRCAVERLFSVCTLCGLNHLTKGE